MDLDRTLARTQEDLFWLPRDASRVERPEVLYVHSARDEGYLNAVLRLDARDAQLASLVAEVGAAHARVASRWMLRGDARRPAVESALAEAGYAPEHEHFGYAVELDTYAARPAPGIAARRVRTEQELADGMRVSSLAFGRAESAVDPELRRAELEACTREGARVARFVAYDEASGEALGSAGLNVYPALGFGFLWAGGTAPGARGRGVYRALVAARVAFAREVGLRAVGLYARAQSSAPLVAKQGFARLGPMTYWLRPAPSPAR